MNGMEHLAQAERDCVELHKALAKAIGRLHTARAELRTFCFDPLDWPQTRTDDLLEVLARTSRLEHPIDADARFAEQQRACDDLAGHAWSKQP